MPCWNLQPGAKGAQDIVVIIGASLNPDGRVAHAWVKNKSHLIQDPFKLAAAETAQRAILNQACQPFKLDPAKYDIWKLIQNTTKSSIKDDKNELDKIIDDFKLEGGEEFIESVIGEDS